MAEFLAYRILQGKLIFAKVPERLQKDVKEILVDMGKPELAE